jgi:putative ABC transport system ATP-binding protein
LQSMQEDKPILELQNIHKNYGTTEVLKGVNLTVNHGDFISIRGKSGAGKTNLFKIIGLLENPNKGTVNLFGKDASMLNDNQKADLRLKQMGLVFQFFNLLPSLTILENIELPMSLNGTKKQDRLTRANELLSFFELTKLADRYPGNLSGGEKQRVAIMRALVNYPSLLIADEPTSSLDDENSELLLDLLCKIQKEQKVSILITSTDLYEKLPSTKDYMLKEGKVTEIP